MAVPKIRFPGFTDAWEQRKLGDVIEIESGMDYKSLNPGDIPVYGTGGYMLSVDKALSYERDAIGIGRKGTIDKPYILKAPFWTVDTLFYCIPKENYSLNFVHCIFQKINWKKKDESTGVPSLSKTIIKNIPEYFPSLSEQKKLGKFFSSLDDTITLHQRKLESMKLLKKSLLQKMFPKSGETVPEVRFPGFTDAWEQRKLGQIIEVKPFKPYIAEANNTGKYPVIQQGDKPLLGYSDKNEPFRDYKSVTLFGDHTLSLFKPLEPFFVATDGIKILSSAMYGLFFYYLLDRYKPHSEGYKRHFSILKEQDCWITSQNEQEKIGNFFFGIDQAITLHQRELICRN